MIWNAQGYSRTSVDSTSRNGQPAPDEPHKERLANSVANWLRQCQERFSPDSPGAAYAFVVICVTIATCFRVAFGWMDPGQTLLFAPYYPTILLVSLLCGVAPGILAIVLSLVVVWLAFVFPFYGVVMPTEDLIARFAFFFAMASLTVWIADSYRALMRRLREEQRERLILMKELQHRTRNSLTVVQAIINRTLRGHRENAEKINNRIKALAATDELITQSTDRLVDLKDIAALELRPYGDTRVSIQGNSVILAPILARTIALVFHELTTNAVKYGALSKPNGRVSVTWGIIAGRIHLAWIESGGPPVAPPTGHGFGMDLIDSLTKSFNGLGKCEFHPDGLVHEISFVLPKSESRHSRSF